MKKLHIYRVSFPLEKSATWATLDAQHKRHNSNWITTHGVLVGIFCFSRIWKKESLLSFNSSTNYLGYLHRMQKFVDVLECWINWVLQCSAISMCILTRWPAELSPWKIWIHKLMMWIPLTYFPSNTLLYHCPKIHQIFIALEKTEYR